MVEMLNQLGHASEQTLLSDQYQDKAPSLGFVPLKGDILEKARGAVERIGK
jgi:phosphate transport system substrate-binding protein